MLTRCGNPTASIDCFSGVHVQSRSVMGSAALCMVEGEIYLKLGKTTHLKTVQYSRPDANSDTLESQIDSSSPSGPGTTARTINHWSVKFSVVVEKRTYLERSSSRSCIAHERFLSSRSSRCRCISIRFPLLSSRSARRPPLTPRMQARHRPKRSTVHREEVLFPSRSSILWDPREAPCWSGW